MAKDHSTRGGTDEESAAPQPRRPSRLRRWTRRIALAAAAALLGLVGLYLTRAHTLHPLLTRVVPWAAPRWTPYDVRVESISGDWLHGLAVRGLSLVNRSPAGTLRRVEAAEAAVELSLPGLLWGRADAVERLRLAGGRVDLDLTAAQAGPEESGADGPPPSWLPLVEVTDLDVELLTAADRRVVLGGLAVRSRREPEGPVYEVSAPEVRTDWVAGPAGTVSLSATLRAPRGRPEEPAEPVADLTVQGTDLSWAGRHLDHLSLEGSLDLDQARVSRLQAREGEDWLEGRDLVLPLGGGLEALLAGARGTLKARVSDLVPWIHGDDPPADPPPRHAVALTATVGDGLARFEGGRVEVAGGELQVTGGAYELTAPPADRGRHLALDATASAFDLAAVGELLGDGGWSGRVEGELHLEGDLPQLQGWVSLGGEGVVVAGFDLGTVRVEGSGDAEGIVVTHLDAVTEDLRLELTGGMRYAEESLEDLRLDLEVLRPHRFAELLAPGGALTARARLHGRWDAPSGELAVQGLGLVLGGVPLEDLVLDASADGGEVEVGRLQCSTPYGALSAALVARLPRRGEVAQGLAVDLLALSLTRAGRGLELQEPAEIDWEGERVTLQGLRLAGSAGALALDLTMAEGAARAELSAEGLDPTPFLAELLPEGVALAGVDLDLSLERTGRGLAGRAVGSIASLTLAPDVPGLALRLDGSLVDGRAELEELVVEADGTRIVDVTASLPFDPATPFPDGPLRVRGNVALPGERSLSLSLGGQPARLSGRLTGTVDLEGSWRRVTGRVHLDAVDVAVDPPELAQPYLGEPARVRCGLVLGEDLVIEELVLEAPGRGTFTGAGRVGWSLDVARLVNEGVAALGAAPIDLTGHFELPDLGWCDGLVAGLRRTSGRAAGTVFLGGRADDPQLSAEVALREATVRPEGLGEIDALEADLTYGEGILVLRRLSGRLGAAPLELTGTVGLTGGLTGEDPELDLRLSGENVLLARSRGLRMRGDLELGLAGPLEQLTLSGAVHLRNSRLLAQVDLLGFLQGGRSVDTAQGGLVLPSFPEPPLRDLKLDVELDTAQPIRVTGNVARGDLRVALHLGGTGEVITPVGHVFADDLRVVLPGGTMTFERGLVRFSEEDLFEPRLELLGEARLAGYDVVLEVSGPLGEPQVEASSSPPLRTEELLLLVVTGRIPAVGTRAQSAGQAIGVFLARDLVRRWAGGVGLDDDPDFFDRFELVTGREVSKSGLLTLEASYRWRDGIARPQDALYVVAERDVHNDVNIGLRFVFRGR